MVVHRRYVFASTRQQVVVRFLDALQEWLTVLPHRSDYCSRLLPYVAAMLPESQSTSRGRVGELAWQVLHAAGAQYARDQATVMQVVRGLACAWRHKNTREKQEARAYLPDKEDGLCLVPMPAQAVAALYVNGHLSPLPARPDAPTRLLLQQNLGPMAAALAADLRSWQGEPQARAVMVLPWWVALVEGDAAFHVHTLLPSMCQVCCK